MRVALFLICVALPLFGQAITQPPKLLLTPQRLRRLQRDRERQTPRWVNFENRVQSVPGSPERGFELALYYAITQDEKTGRDAIAWALAHPCDLRQTALVLDWAGNLIAPPERAKLTAGNCTGSGASSVISDRNALFLDIATGKDPAALIAETAKPLIASLEASGAQMATELYAACEYLAAVRFTQHTDLRQEAPRFFTALPARFLLSRKPAQIEHPDSMSHIAALALVGLDPNLEGSQYLQGWAIEDRQMLREGPGVAYELLWADPYLPGVGYQNLDPWMYDGRGQLYARKDWSADSCWIHISASGLQQENCAPGWRNSSAVFGHMSLVPMLSKCANVPARNRTETVILWNLQPNAGGTYIEDKKQRMFHADAAGLWRVPQNITGNVCAAP